MSDIPESLKNVWEIENNVAKQDVESINPILKMEYFYQTDLYPQPWWGNIEKPKIIVLALNPSYDPITDDEDEKYIEQDLKSNLSTRSFNWFNHKKVTLNSGKERETSGFKWWKQTLGDLYNETNEREKNIYEKIGFFQLVGYHSKTYSKLIRKCFMEKHKCFPTQNAIVNHVNEIIREDNPIVVVLWGYQHWIEVGLKISDDRVIRVNKKNHYNHNITKAPEEYDELISVIKKIIK